MGFVSFVKYIKVLVLSYRVLENLPSNKQRVSTDFRQDKKKKKDNRIVAIVKLEF